jgi:lysozyme family protein
MNFDEAFELLIGHEGGFSNDARDSGNWTSGQVGVGKLKGTKYGISAASYPRLDIANLTLREAKIIYQQDFWIEGLPPSIAFDFFDTAVNSGKKRAILLLQKSLGVTEDGKFGPNTMAALAQATPMLSSIFNAHRLLFMADARSWDTHGKGWTRRVANNLLLGAKQ